MRAVACSVVLLVLLASAGTTALAQPFPKSAAAAKHVVRDTLRDADQTAADALLAAHKLVRDMRKGIPTLPSAEGDIEVRAVLKQPGIQGRDELLSAMWVGADAGTWRGVYWIVSSEGTTFPGLLEVDQNGILLMLDGGRFALGDRIDATYHFLDLDGRHTTRDMGRFPLLPATPTVGRADLGGAIATEGSASHPPAILLSPWNLFGANATIGVTLRAGDAELESVTAPACGDIEATETEPGCRLLYALPLAPELTTLEVWHLEGGERVVDRELTRAELIAGYTFAG